MKKAFRYLFFISVSVVVSCGVKGGPKPPYTTAPETVKEVKIKQQDGQLIVYWWYKPRYADGRPMNERFRFEIFTLDHRIIKKISNEGELYWFNYRFSSDKEYCFRFQVVTKENRSRFSRYFCYIPTPDYPRVMPEFKLTIIEKGIKISWEKSQYKTNIYRSRKKVYYPVPYISLEKGNSYVDTKVSNGTQLCYYLTYEDENGVESYPSPIKCATFRDIFPPEPPKNPTVIFKDGSYYLIWSDSPSKDVAGYVIVVNGKAVNKEPVKDYVYLLKNFKKGDTVQIYAVDRAGNRSRPVTVKLNNVPP